MVAKRPGASRLRKPLSMIAFPGVVGLVAVAAFVATMRIPLLAFGPTRAAPVVAAPPSRASLNCDVAYVNDGDTLRCRDGARIRLHATAARERDGTCSPGHPCPAASAEAATRELRAMVSGGRLQCEPTGEFGSLLESSSRRTQSFGWSPVRQPRRRLRDLICGRSWGGAPSEVRT